MFAKPLFVKGRSIYQPIKMNLQHFADSDDDSDDDDSDDKSGDGTPNLAELLEDPEFKKQYEADMKTKLGKRLRKYKNVDLEEYERLKAEAGNKKDDDSEDDDKSDNKESSKLDEHEKRLARAERKEKRAAIKEYAMDNKLNGKLAARLINIDDIEMDEDGEPTNLDELFSDLADDFPDQFGEKDDEEEKEEETTTSRYNPGRGKGNKTKPKDARKAGAERAKARHQKEEA